MSEVEHGKRFTAAGIITEAAHSTANPAVRSYTDKEKEAVKVPDTDATKYDRFRAFMVSTWIDEGRYNEAAKAGSIPSEHARHLIKATQAAREGAFAHYSRAEQFDVVKAAFAAHDALIELQVRKNAVVAGESSDE